MPFLPIVSPTLFVQVQVYVQSMALLHSTLPDRNLARNSSLLKQKTRKELADLQM